MLTLLSFTVFNLKVFKENYLKPSNSVYIVNLSMECKQKKNRETFYTAEHTENLSFKPQIHIFLINIELCILAKRNIYAKEFNNQLELLTKYKLLKGAM